MYRRIKRQERKMNTGRKAGSTGRTFSKLGEWKELPSKFKQYESDAIDQTMSQSYAFRNSITLPFFLLTALFGQFQQLLKTRLVLIHNFTRHHAITYTNRNAFIFSQSSRGLAASRETPGNTVRRHTELSFTRGVLDTDALG